MTPAAAAPIYLSSTIVHAEGPFTINITADEGSQLVTIEIPKTGYVERLAESPPKARFRPTTPAALDMRSVEPTSA